MLKKTLLGILILVLVAGLGVFFWARSVLGGDAVRNALAARLSTALGQPVSIGAISAGILPRVSVNLSDVKIGSHDEIAIRSLAIGTDLRALISRRIEHGAVRSRGVRVQLPLPPLSFPAGGADQAPGPIQIISIDDVVLNDVDIVSGGRTLHGDIDIVPQGQAILVRKIALTAENAAVNITGRISDVAGPVGELTVSAGALDLDQLLAFASAFSKNAVAAAPSSARSGARGSTAASMSAPFMNVGLSLAAERATLGTLRLDKLSGHAQVTSSEMALNPASFNVFGGHYGGSLTLTLDQNPEFRVKAALSDVDVAAATAYAGIPDTLTGKLSGQMDVTGRGVTAPAAEKTARGTLHVSIANGIVRNLGLIQAVVVATSMRSDASSPAGSSRDEAFSRLGGTLAISDGEARTNDLTLEGKDLTVNAAGTLRLDGTALNLKGQVQLSEALSQQSGRDLFRYTQQNGRVTLPLTVTGAAASPHVSIDVADVATRALRNRAGEEIKKGIGRLFGK